MGHSSDCSVCKKEVKGGKAVACSRCDDWVHLKCSGLSAAVYTGMRNENLLWFCNKCLKIVNRLIVKSGSSPGSGPGSSTGVRLTPSSGPANLSQGAAVASDGPGRPVTPGLAVPSGSGINSPINNNNANDRWVKVKNGCKPKCSRVPGPLPMANRFAGLDVETEVLDSVVFVGDSMIRDQAINYRNKTGKRSRGFCFSGAGVAEVDNFLKSSTAPRGTTVITIGTNDVGSLTSEALKSKYKDLLRTLGDRRCPAVLMGILPRMSVGGQWCSRAIGMNIWLSEQCSALGLPFVDLWDVFVRSPHLYKLDGVHLNNKGKYYICDILEELLQEGSFCSTFLG